MADEENDSLRAKIIHNILKYSPFVGNSMSIEMDVLYYIFTLFVLLPVLLRSMAFDYPFGIFKLFLSQRHNASE
jgi:hypothetical protein